MQDAGYYVEAKFSWDGVYKNMHRQPIQNILRKMQWSSTFYYLFKTRKHAVVWL